MIDMNETQVIFDSVSSENREITRNLQTLYRTPIGTVPMDRNFGINQDFISYPLDVAQNMFVLEITEKTQIYEPRVEVMEVSFKSNIDGNLTAYIRIGRSEGGED